MTKHDWDELPADIDPKVGMQLQTNQGNGIMIITITDVSETIVKIDANHPIAGQDLTLEIELVEIGVSPNQARPTVSHESELTSIPLPQALSNGQPTIAEFGRGTCVPCKQMKPILEELAKEYEGEVNVLIISVDEYRDSSRQYGIMAIPTQIFFDSSGQKNSETHRLLSKRRNYRSAQEDGDRLIKRRHCHWRKEQIPLRRVCVIQKYFLMWITLSICLLPIVSCARTIPPAANGVELSTYQLEVGLLGIIHEVLADTQGRIKTNVELSSADGKVSLSLKEGTIVMDKEGKPLEFIHVAIDPTLPLRPEDAHIVGAIYDLSPEGATFDPPLKLTISYDPEELPEGAREAKQIKCGHR
ncbi:thioredoxin domain-containing protein [Chloroflexota bacterium]